MTTSNVKKPSRFTTRDQDTKSSASLDACPCDCGRSGQRLTHEPALLRMAPLATGDLDGQCSDRSPISYPTARSRRRRRLVAEIRAGRSWGRRSRFPLSSHVERAHAASVAPLQILIFACFDAEMRSRESGSAPLIFSNDPNIDFWLCLTFCDRLFCSRFSSHADRLPFVGQKLSQSSTHRGPALLSHLPGKDVKEVPGRFGNLVSMTARGVRRLPSLVLPNNCIGGERW